MVAKKGGSRGGMGGADDAEEELARTPLQAIIFADSFTTKFRPITLERPKVTLLSIPLTDFSFRCRYSLATVTSVPGNLNLCFFS